MSEYADLADRLLALAEHYQWRGKNTPGLYVSPESVAQELFKLLEPAEMHDSHTYVPDKPIDDHAHSDERELGYCAACGCSKDMHAKEESA